MYPFASFKIFTNCKVNSPLNTVPKKPFFHVTTKNSAIRHFLDALTSYDFIKASNYISRKNENPLETVSLVNDFLVSSKNERGWEYKWLLKMKFSKEDSGTQSILIIHEKKMNDILHLHLVKEPDNFSTWKINKVEKE